MPTAGSSLGEISQDELMGILSGPGLAMIEAWGGPNIPSYMVALAAMFTGYKATQDDSPLLIGVSSALGNWAVRRYKYEKAMAEAAGTGAVSYAHVYGPYAPNYAPRPVQEVHNPAAVRAAIQAAVAGEQPQPQAQPFQFQFQPFQPQPMGYFQQNTGRPRRDWRR